MKRFLLSVLLYFNCCILLVFKKIRNSDLFSIKPTRCTNISNLFLHKTLHVSGSSSAHHQESLTVRSALVCVMQVLTIAYGQGQVNLFLHKTLHVSGSSSAHHQESLTGILALPISCRQNLHNTNQCRTYGERLLMMGRGTARNM